MNDSIIRDFCIRARNELRDQVALRARLYGITAEGYADPAADVIDGRVLSPLEVSQRRDLISRFLAGPEDTSAERYEALIERAAYTWFNRLVAIRYMEVNDRLPSHVRMLSAADGGSFASQAMAEALTIEIEGIDRARVAELVSAADDEALFRYLFLAQCDELAACLPEVFEPIGSAMELLLPDALLRRGGVASQLVEDIPEEDWKEGVEIVGWMYQYYNAERKDEAFASFKKGKKAEADALAPATQLFTPDWIVRYLVENSLGRAWVQTHSDSSLPKSMPYYIADEEPVEATPVASPEDLSVIDPACGSGHILVYAFDLMSRIYEEAGYSRRDIAQLILTKNLTGLEIDPRAAALASFALSMKGCELDSRFLTRGVIPRIVTMVPVVLDEGELESLPMLAERAELLDAMAHASECGSLFQPSEGDMISLQCAKEVLESRGDLLSAGTLAKVETMIANCEPLAKSYDVVVANPPYMGSSNMGKWLANWTKKRYPDSKRDLCTCFIERGFTLAMHGGYSAMVTMESWMFLGSFENLRKRILKEHSISALLYMNHMVMRIAFNTSATVFRVGLPGQIGIYTKVEYVDLNEDSQPESFPIERHGIYRRGAEAFSAIPGSPIAYWASEATRRAFEEGDQISSLVKMPYGFKTGDNDRFLRQWWEIPEQYMAFPDSKVSRKWVPYNKGGYFRKWYGNNDYLLNFENGGHEVLNDAEVDGRSAAGYDSTLYFKELVTWSRISSGRLALRHMPQGSISDMTGSSVFGDSKTLSIVQAFCNSSVGNYVAEIISPTLDFQPGQVGTYPILKLPEQDVEILVVTSRALSRQDYDSVETSWDFKRHPMV